jgi:hypothetical protein
MIYIYGDSHASSGFKDLPLEHVNCYCSSITMFRIGRDNIIINFNKDIIKSNDTIVLVYGEVDCRCHIHRQIKLGFNEDDVIYDLVNKYIQTIQNNTKDMNINIVIVGVIPPTKIKDYEKFSGEVKHEFPFIGTDEDRVRYTYKVNTLLEELSIQNKYLYFNPYDYYINLDGTLNHELSDTFNHILYNTHILDKFVELYQHL